MKKLATLSLSLLLITSLKATVITVDNKPSNNGAQYSDLQTAITAATPGDTILVAGSPTKYGLTTALIIDKEVHLIGAGFRPSKQSPYPSTLGQVNLYSRYNPSSPSASNSSIQGFDIVSGLYLTGYTPTQRLTGIQIYRNKLSGITLYSHTVNNIVYNNIIGYISGSTQNTLQESAMNCIFSNNIIQNYYGKYSGPTIFEHNIFINGNNGQLLSLTNNSIFTNNIFYKYSANNNGIANCTFSNNLSYFTPGVSTLHDFPTTGTNSGGNNLIGLDPLFIQQTNSFFVYTTDDLNLSSNSPAKNAATNGSDIGIYGGSYPWPDGGTSGSGYMYSQEPQFPQVNQMNINTVSIPQNGTLNVTVKGIKND
jgi:hypothetical protein